MKPNVKKKAFALLCAATMLLSVGCASEPTPYETNDLEGYTVSVRFDANGGFFTTDVATITDSYSLDGLDDDGDGTAEIPLISPDDARRGNDSFPVTRNGYFLAGWYKNRTESKDAEYVYSDKWDFESDLLSVKTDGDYASDTPVMTLYAAWIPLFTVDFYSADTGELMESFSFDPTVTKEIAMPEWSEDTGKINMHDFPQRSGFTYRNAYYDSDCKNAVEGDHPIHNGVIDFETGTASDTTLDLYLEWDEGEWFRIYNAEQLADNASVSGKYEIMADLDFADEIWPTALMYGSFSGEIVGNGHVIKNVSAEQTNTSKTNAGIFGSITENAIIKDICFENASFTLKKGTRVAGTSYGLLAGSISTDADISGLEILGSVLSIDSDCYFGTDDYTIGLICGNGAYDKVSNAEIECRASGESPESIVISTDGNSVTVETAE